MHTYEDLVELRRMAESKAFAHVAAIYDRELDRLDEKLFSKSTTREDAEGLRQAMIELRRLHPKKILEEAAHTCREKVEAQNKNVGYPSW